jgi:hypothetical protein
MNSVMLIQSQKKLLPNLGEYYLQGFPNKEISMFKILYMVCAVRSSENADEGNIEEWLQGDLVNWASST